MVPSTCGLEVQFKKKNECIITRIYEQKIYLTNVSFESEGGSTMMHPGHHKKATL